MITIVKEPFDVGLQDIVIVPASLLGDCSCIYGRLPRPLAMGVFREFWFDQRIKDIRATAWAALPPIVETPSFQILPFFLGMSTSRTGAGKQVPERNRFQVLYRLSSRCPANLS